MSEQNENFIKIPSHILEDGRLKPYDVLVFLGLSYFSDNKTGECWPSAAALAEKLHVSKPVVWNSIRRLEEFGLIEITKTEGGVNHYLISGKTKIMPRKADAENKDGKTAASSQSLISTWAVRQAALVENAVKVKQRKNFPAVLEKWRETYGEEFTAQNIRQALLWLEENHKKYSDMSRFIGAWLRRSAEKNDGAKQKDSDAALSSEEMFFRDIQSAMPSYYDRLRREKISNDSG